MHKNKLNKNSKEDLNCTCKEVYDSKKGKLLTLDWNVGKQELRFFQAGYSINIPIEKIISQSAITIDEFHLKRCQDLMFTYLLCFLSFSTSNLKFTFKINYNQFYY